MATRFDPFQIALNEVELIITEYPDGELTEKAKMLGVRLRLLRSFCNCGRMWLRGEACRSTLLSIEETVYQHALEIQAADTKLRSWRILHPWVSKLFDGVHQFFCLRFRDPDDDGDGDQQMTSDTKTMFDHLRKWRSKLIGCIHRFVCIRLRNHSPDMQHLHFEFLLYIQLLSFREEMDKLYHIFSEISLQTVSSSQEILFLIGIIDSLSKNTLDLQGMNHSSHYVEWLQVCASFLKGLICFAFFRGVELRQMESLLTLTQCFVVDAVHHLSMFCCNQNPQHIAQLSSRGLHTRSHPRGIYVAVLQASKLSLSYRRFTPTDCRVIFKNFVDVLLTVLWSRFVSDTSSAHIFNRQMQELYGKLTFLKSIMLEQPSKFDVLYEKMPALIGLVTCEAGITLIHCFGKETRSSARKLEILFLRTDKYFVKLIEAVKEEDIQVMLASKFPQTNPLGFIDRLLAKIKLIIPYDGDSTVRLSKDELQTLQDNLTVVRSSWVMLQFNQSEMFQALRSRITAVAYETEFILDSSMAGGDLDGFTKILDKITVAVKLVNAESSDSFRNQKQIDQVAEISRKMPLAGEIPVLEDGMVGLNDEVEKIINRLTRGTENLDTVSIVGMPGLGKTMVAKKVYKYLFNICHFDVHSWCTISQVYNKRSLLIEILRELPDFDGKCSEMDEGDLSLKLFQKLKGQRYLIILDDVWDIAAWNNLSYSFPNDVNRSRILITSRHQNLAVQIKLYSEPLNLRLLHVDESWELMQKILGFKEGCPQDLFACVMEILQECGGLPLMILIVAGLLSNMKPGAWEEVRESLKKGTQSLAEKCMETIELSYSYLPDHLKECFLYFGAIGGDQIPVRKLLWLWMAEGFLQKNGRESSEDLADGYLKELIQRNLVMVGKKGSRETIKSCVLHDLLRDLCLKKYNEDHFLQSLQGYEFGNSFNSSISYRLHFSSRMQGEFAESRLICPRLRTLFIVADHEVSNSQHSYGILLRFRQSKLLRVLDLITVNVGSCFPVVIESLVHLRYLALQIAARELLLPSSIADLLKLETLNMLTTGFIVLPDTLWNMKNLKHLCVTGLLSHWILPDNYIGDGSTLENLKTLSGALFHSDLRLMELMRELPNIRRLRYRCINMIPNKIVALDFTSQLESLTISDHQTDGDLNFQFPQNLKKLTLKNLCLPWSKSTAFDRLPNLEVLKLQRNAFTGETWDMEEEGTFPKLRFLKLEDLDLARWTDSYDNFPCLQNLVLISCHLLEELPSCLAQSSTLLTIEVINCEHVTASINQIQQEQMDLGNEDLKVRMLSSDVGERMRDVARLFRNIGLKMLGPPHVAEASDTVDEHEQKQSSS